LIRVEAQVRREQRWFATSGCGSEARDAYDCCCREKEGEKGRVDLSPSQETR
jgi:hypothetical protein